MNEEKDTKSTVISEESEMLSADVGLDAAGADKLRNAGRISDLNEHNSTSFGKKRGSATRVLLG